jgi:hypothetical protein
VGYEKGRNGPCGGVDPLQNRRSSRIRVRRARCGGAPGTPEVMAPTGEKVRVGMREREKKVTLWMIVIHLDLLAP